VSWIKSVVESRSGVTFPSECPMAGDANVHGYVQTFRRHRPNSSELWNKFGFLCLTDYRSHSACVRTPRLARNAVMWTVNDNINRQLWYLWERMCVYISSMMSSTCYTTSDVTELNSDQYQNSSKYTVSQKSSHL